MLPKTRDMRTRMINIEGVIPVEGMMDSKRSSIDQAPFCDLTCPEAVFVICAVL